MCVCFWKVSVDLILVILIEKCVWDFLAEFVDIEIKSSHEMNNNILKLHENSFIIRKISILIMIVGPESQK